jgi:hypothetical protein
VLVCILVSNTACAESFLIYSQDIYIYIAFLKLTKARLVYFFAIFRFRHGKYITVPPVTRESHVVRIVTFIPLTYTVLLHSIFWIHRLEFFGDKKHDFSSLGIRYVATVLLFLKFLFPSIVWGVPRQSCPLTFFSSGHKIRYSLYVSVCCMHVSIRSTRRLEWKPLEGWGKSTCRKKRPTH